jgi:glucosamine-6-phosphate deaminase
MPFEYPLAKFIPFRDEAACARVRAITRSELTKHSNPDFKIAILDDPARFYSRFALDIVTRITDAAKAGKKCVLILPVGPVPQFAIAAEMINRLGIDCRHLVTYNMDEYADDTGKTAPADWEGSFATAMRQAFFAQIREDLRPKDQNIHFPTDKNIEDYHKMIEDDGEPTAATAASAGAATSPSGSPTWAWSTRATWPPTSRPTAASSSSTP